MLKRIIEEMRNNQTIETIANNLHTATYQGQDVVPGPEINAYETSRLQTNRNQMKKDPYVSAQATYHRRIL